MFKFYLQICAGIQCGFLVSRGRCPTCKRFRPKTYETYPRLWSLRCCYRTRTSYPRLTGRRGTKPLSLTYLHTEKSRGVKSGDRGGQAIVPPRPIQASTVRLRWGVISRWKCGGSHLVEKWNLCPNLPFGDVLIQTGALSWFSWTANEGLPHIFYRLICNTRSTLASLQLRYSDSFNEPILPR
jgi:hypothetical protein